LFKSYNIPVVDADVLARQVVLPGTRAYRQIVAYFGRDILQEDGTLDRPKLGSIVFNNQVKRKKLNSIVHPAVRRAMFWAIVKYWLKGEKMCVVDVPLLIESGIHKWVGKVVVVYCSAEIQLRRLMKRDSSSREAAMSRLNAQLPIAEKLEYADQVIDNSGTVQELQQQVSAFIERLRNEVSWTWRLEWLVPPLGILSGLWTLLWRMVKRNRRAARTQRTRTS